MAKTNDEELTEKAIAELEKLYVFLEADPDVIAAMPIEDVEEGLREIGLVIDAPHYQATPLQSMYESGDYLPISSRIREMEIGFHQEENQSEKNDANSSAKVYAACASNSFQAEPQMPAQKQAVTCLSHLVILAIGICCFVIYLSHYRSNSSLSGPIERLLLEEGGYLSEAANERNNKQSESHCSDNDKRVQSKSDKSDILKLPSAFSAIQQPQDSPDTGMAELEDGTELATPANMPQDADNTAGSAEAVINRAIQKVSVGSFGEGKLNDGIRGKVLETLQDIEEVTVYPDSANADAVLKASVHEQSMGRYVTVKLYVNVGNQCRPLTDLGFHGMPEQTIADTTSQVVKTLFTRGPKLQAGYQTNGRP